MTESEKPLTLETIVEALNKLTVAHNALQKDFLALSVERRVDAQVLQLLVTTHPRPAGLLKIWSESSAEQISTDLLRDMNRSEPIQDIQALKDVRSQRFAFWARMMRLAEDLQNPDT